MTNYRQTDGSCCDGTGYADYAAVPCPNPDCPVTQPATVDDLCCPQCGGSWTTGIAGGKLSCADPWHFTHFPMGTAKVREL